MKPSTFVAITSEGGLLPADFLAELLAPKSAIEGLEPAAYNLAEGERINEQVNRSWNRLQGRWADFKKAVANKQPGESTTTETRDRWLQPIFQELGFGQRLPLTPPVEVDGRTYPVSHGWNYVPIHLVGSHLDLDRRTPGATGAAKHSPHSLVQQVLNASDGRLWGIVSNGLTFRLLRDNVALTRLSLVEWDLAAIFDGDLYAEFFLLWLVAHQSRFDAERPQQCWLERWRKLAEDKGLRALEQLRPGVARAIEALGAGLVSHPANQRLRARLSRGELSTQDFYRQVLRVVYRLLFLFVAEDRGLLHPPLPKDDPAGEAAALQARHRYHEFYSVTRLRDLSLHRAGTPHPDLWNVFQLVARILGSKDGCPALALPALGSFLWDAARSTPDLTDALVSNRHFLSAIHAIAYVQDGSVRRPIDYKNLGSEELGSVYEGLLELHPRINADAGQFELDIAAGNERKTTGSYYTPDSLVQCLLDSALEPVVAEAVGGKDGPAAAEAILKLKVCDPAVGSGHFLIAAAHRIAKRLAAARSGEEEPSPAVYRTALRDVIGHCLYGVDINPMSAELCRVSLWMEALEPGKPLSFLEHHVQVGNSLLGTTPALLAGGIPDDAFTAIEGDVKARVSELKKQNKRERRDYASGQGYLFEPHFNQGNMAADFALLNAAPDGTLAEVTAIQDRYAELVCGSDYQSGRLLADTWCAAFVWKKDDSDLGKLCPTERVFREIQASGELRMAIGTAEPSSPFAILHSPFNDEAIRLRDQYQFFHWHLAFPDVFRLPGKDERPENEQTGWSGGFDVVLGNPPWERIQVEAIQFFETRRPELLNMKRSDRENAIRRIETTDKALFDEWMSYRRFDLAATAFMKASARYPLSTQKNVNSYAVFLELALSVNNLDGFSGLILQSGVVTDDIMKPLFQALVTQARLVSFFDFVNTEGLFPGIHRTHPHFCLLTTATTRCRQPAEFSFWNSNPSHLLDSERRFTLSSQEIALLNPNTRTCPIFRLKRDAELAKRIYARVPVLWKEGDNELNSWPVAMRRVFDMTYDSHLFRTESQLQGSGCGVEPHHEFATIVDRWVRLYEAKFIHQFDHRFATFAAEDGVEISAEEHDRPDITVKPRYWVRETELIRKLADTGWDRQWLISVRDITNSTNERTAIVSIVPRAGLGNTAYSVTLNTSEIASEVAACFAAGLNSFCFDSFARQKVSGTHLNIFILKQLPVLPPDTYAEPCPWSAPNALTPTPPPLSAWLLPRVLELTYTAWDLEPFARDCGYAGPPFRWDEERRFLLRAELDAAFFHLYLQPEANGEWGVANGESDAQGNPLAIRHSLLAAFPTPRDAVAYILDTFPIVRRKDEAKYAGDYRTKRVILEIYDAMLESIRTGRPYPTRLDPPPGPPAEGLPDWTAGATRPADWPSHIHPPRTVAGTGHEPKSSEESTLDA